MTAPLPADWFLRSRLKMRHVVLLVAIDDQRSIHKAARELSMTQPAATKLLADLEDLLSLKLFDRTTRGLVPTQHGESLVRHSRAMLGTLDHARSELEAISGGATGRLAIGVLLVVAPVLLPQALLLFKRQNPRVTVHVREGSLAALLPLLHSGELDLILGRLTADFDSNGLHFEQFYDEPMTVVVRKGHPLRRKKGLKLTDLVHEPWILPPPETAYRHRLDAAFRQEGVEPPAQLIESMSILTNKTLVEESDILGVMPLNVGKYYASLGTIELLPVALPHPSGPVGIITRSTTELSGSLHELIAALRTTGGRLAGGRAVDRRETRVKSGVPTRSDR